MHQDALMRLKKDSKRKKIIIFMPGCVEACLSKTGEITDECGRPISLVQPRRCEWIGSD